MPVPTFPARCALLACAGAALAWPAGGDVRILATEATRLSSEPEQTLYAVSTRVDRIGRIVAPVHINDQGPFLFMLDTGANRTVLSSAAARRLGLVYAGGSIAVQGVNGRSVAPAVRVRHLAAGALRLDNIAMPVLAGPVFERLDGILGMDGLAGKKVTADFVRDRITIVESRGRRAPIGHIVIQGRLVAGLLLMIDGRVGRIRVKAIVDTGGTRTLGNPALQRALTTRGRRRLPSLATSVIDATEQQRRAELAASPAITLGAATIRDTAITYGDFEIFRVWGLEDEPALLIGMDVLGTLAEVAIDYRRQELQLRTRGS